MVTLGVRACFALAVLFIIYFFWYFLLEYIGFVAIFHIFLVLVIPMFVIWIKLLQLLHENWKQGNQHRLYALHGIEYDWQTGRSPDLSNRGSGVADARRSPGISSVTSDVIYRPCMNFNEGASRRKKKKTDSNSLWRAAAEPE